MRVSIIIPVYNVAKYIRRCLISVMDQTIQAGVECILVDDCGQDDSIEIAEELIADYAGAIQFILLHHDRNEGLSAARNTGIRAAKGKYLYFLDSDDYIDNDCIESLYIMTEKYPGVECVFAGAYTDNCPYMDYTSKQLPEYSNDRDWLQIGMLQRYLFSMTAWNRLILTDFVKTNKLFFEERYIHEDDLWNFAISQNIKCASFLKRNTYHYTTRADGIMGKLNENKHLSLEKRFLSWNRMLSNISGHRTAIQPYYITSFASGFLDMASRISDCLRFNKLLFSAMIQSGILYKLRLFRRLIGWNCYFLTKCLSGLKTHTNL